MHTGFEYAVWRAMPEVEAALEAHLDPGCEELAAS
jgi:hypothetical protein